MYRVWQKICVWRFNLLVLSIVPWQHSEKILSKKKQRSKKHVLKALLYRSSENHSLKMFLIVYFIFKISIVCYCSKERYKVTEWFRWNILFTFTFFCINLLHKLVADFYTFPVKVILQSKITFTFSGPFDYRMTRIRGHS